jgi:serine/threonine-protein kinase
MEVSDHVDPESGEELGEQAIDEVAARARREVETLSECNSRHLVQLGPIPLTEGRIGAQTVLYYTEEWIDGEDLKAILARNRRLPVDEVVRLGRDITSAIEELWAHKKVHRDVKPGNIMRRNDDGSFVLLDMGVTLALMDKSLTTFGQVPGTQLYLSPDQVDFAHKRLLDFRSDLFALGIVMYEACTGVHPFATPDPRVSFVRLLTAEPLVPSQVCGEVPQVMDAIVMRLLSKKPHLRYRSCNQLIEELSRV